MEEEIQAFLRYARLTKGLAEQTAVAYERDLYEFAFFLRLTKRPAWQELTRKDLEEYFAYLAKSDRGARTRNRHRSSLRQFYRFARREGLTERDPTELLEAPKFSQALPNFLTSDEVERLLRQPDKGTAIGIRDVALLEVLYSSGLRISELLGLRLSHVMEEGYVRVRGKGSKERLVPIHERALAAVWRYIRDVRVSMDPSQKKPWLFLSPRGGQLTREAVWVRLKQYATQAKISKSVYAHAMRHTFATHLLDNGADISAVKELLGHVSIQTTQIYTHVSKKRLSEAYHSAHPRSGGVR